MLVLFDPVISFSGIYFKEVIENKKWCLYGHIYSSVIYGREKLQITRRFSKRAADKQITKC